MKKEYNVPVYLSTDWVEHFRIEAETYDEAAQIVEDGLSSRELQPEREYTGDLDWDVEWNDWGQEEV